MLIRAGKAWTRAERRFVSWWTRTEGEEGVWEKAGEKRLGREGPEPGEVLRRKGVDKN